MIQGYVCVRAPQSSLDSCADNQNHLFHALQRPLSSQVVTLAPLTHSCQCAHAPRDVERTESVIHDPAPRVTRYILDLHDRVRIPVHVAADAVDDKCENFVSHSFAARWASLRMHSGSMRSA
jgi:hypothetical protein